MTPSELKLDNMNPSRLLPILRRPGLDYSLFSSHTSALGAHYCTNWPLKYLSDTDTQTPRNMQLRQSWPVVQSLEFRCGFLKLGSQVPTAMHKLEKKGCGGGGGELQSQKNLGLAT